MREYPSLEIIQVSCVLPPPRSMTRPLTSEKLLATPSAPIRPSSAFERSSTVQPVAAVMRSRNSLEFWASRVASVATTRMFVGGTPYSEQTIAKRRMDVTMAVVTSSLMGDFTVPVNWAS